MSQRQRQLTLVFSSSNPITGRPSPQRRMLRCDLLKRSPRTESPFLSVMRELEERSPEHAAVLLSLASDILDEPRKRGWPPIE